MIWIIVCSIIFLLFSTNYFYKVLRTYKLAKQLPGPKIVPYLGNFTFIFCDETNSLPVVEKLVSQFKNGYRIMFLTELEYIIFSAEDFEKILSSTKHISKGFGYKVLEQLLGTGLLCSTGEKWHQRRKLLTPAFHFNILQQFLGIFKDESKKLVNTIKMDKFNSTDDDSDGIDLNDISSRITLNTICETAMGINLDTFNQNSVREYRKNINKITELIVKRIFNPLEHSDFTYKLFGYKKYMDKFIDPVHRFTNMIINNRRKIFNRIKLQMNNEIQYSTPDNIRENIYFNKKQRAAMLDTLLQAESNDMNTIDSEGIREEVDTFIFEGFDTTQSALTFTLFMLAHHKDVQQKTYNEIKEIYDNNNNEPFDIYHYNRMEYLTCVIKETLRLYPSVPTIVRILDEDIQFDGGLVPKGTPVNLLIYFLHRNEKYFPNPNQFNPERFTLENSQKIHPYAYVPFSAGSRNCIGQKFAMLELKTIITEILLNFHIEPITSIDQLIIHMSLILRSGTSLKVKFRQRNS